jgi:hypothetical protein
MARIGNRIKHQGPAATYGLITNAAPSLDLVGKDPPVFGRLPERSLGFGLLKLVRQPVALGSLGTKIVWPFHGMPHDFSKPNSADSRKFRRKPT